MKNSIWENGVAMPAFPSMTHNLKTDVLIVGGGMAGLLCAYHLARQGVDYTLIEGGKICGGITKDTTAKITSQHGLIYHKLLQMHGQEIARKYWEANEAAIGAYRELAKTIDCDFMQADNYIYSKDNLQELEAEKEALDKLGIPADLIKETQLPFPVKGAVCFRNQAQFHPLKFAAALAKKLNIYEHTPVREFHDNRAITDYGTITAEKIIITTHFPLLNKHGGYFLKLYQQRSYVLALENAQRLEGMYLDAATDGLSFRMAGDLLLLGGGGHRTGKKGGGWEELEAFAKKHYPNTKEVCRWATQDCISLDGIPYIGRYGRNTPNLFVATGFNKWGMTSSMVAAVLLCDLVQGRENGYASVFSPQRRTLRKQLFCNIWESTANLLTLRRPRCPHLGCTLQWNPQERSWDCPCHGSRFDEKGKVLDNPATADLNRRPHI